MTLAYQHSAPSVVISVFVMQGCGACEDFKPRLRTVYMQMQREGWCLPPVEFVDANSPANQAAANHYSVQFTPTTVLRKSNGRWKKWDSALSDVEIRKMLEVAAHGQQGCEL